MMKSEGGPVRHCSKPQGPRVPGLTQPIPSHPRVNRYQKQFTLDDKLAKWKYEESKLDFLEVATLNLLVYIRVVWCVLVWYSLEEAEIKYALYTFRGRHRVTPSV